MKPCDQLADLARARAGDLEARGRLAASVWPFIKQRAGHFARAHRVGRYGVQAADLASEAAIWFLRYLCGNSGWNPARGSLITWTGYVCRGAFQFACGLRNYPGRPSRAWVAEHLSPAAGDRLPGREAEPAEAAGLSELADRAAEAAARLPAADRRLFDRLAAGDTVSAVAREAGSCRFAMAQRARRIRAGVLAYADPSADS